MNGPFAREARRRVVTLSAQGRAIRAATVDRVEEARAVLDRLSRIEELERRGAGPQELLEQLRALVGEAERWARLEGDERALDAVTACESAVLDQVR